MIAKDCEQLTLLLKHSDAAFGCYDTMANSLGANVPKITKKSMRESAQAAQGIEKVSPKAIDFLFNKDEPTITTAATGAIIVIMATLTSVDRVLNTRP